MFPVLFAVLVLANLFPFQPFEPAWQSRIGTVLMNVGTLLPLPVLKDKAAAALD